MIISLKAPHVASFTYRIGQHFLTGWTRSRLGLSSQTTAARAADARNSKEGRRSGASYAVGVSASGALVCPAWLGGAGRCTAIRQLQRGGCGDEGKPKFGEALYSLIRLLRSLANIRQRDLRSCDQSQTSGPIPRSIHRKRSQSADSREWVHQLSLCRVLSTRVHVFAWNRIADASA